MTHARYNAIVTGNLRQFAWNTVSRIARQALLLSLAASFFVCAASARTYELPANASRAPGWILTDFDGDRRADLAAAGPGLRDGGGYIHQVNIDLTGFQASSFIVRGSSPSIRLSFRDVDGDDDRDLIVFEPWSPLPVGVWLNDGTGHFTEGRVADYLATLGTGDSRSFTSQRPVDEPLASLQDQRSTSEFSFIAAVPRIYFSCAAASGTCPPATSVLISAFGPRGPPLNL